MRISEGNLDYIFVTNWTVREFVLVQKYFLKLFSFQGGCLTFSLLPLICDIKAAAAAGEHGDDDDNNNRLLKQDFVHESINYPASRDGLLTIKQKALTTV